MVMGSPGGRYPSLMSGEKMGAGAYRNPYEVGGSLYAYEIPALSSSSGEGDSASKSTVSGAGNGVYDVTAWSQHPVQGFEAELGVTGAPGFYVLHE